MLSFLLTTALAVAAPSSPEATARAMFAAFNAHDPAAMARLYAPDARLASSDFCAPRRGLDVTRTYTELFHEAPDVRDDVDTLIADGERVAARFTAVSAATGIRMQIMTFLVVRDGRIMEDDSVFDTAGRPCSR